MYSPQPKPAERVWPYLRERSLSLRLLPDAEPVVDAYFAAWNTLLADADRLRSSCLQPWIRRVILRPDSRLVQKAPSFGDECVIAGSRALFTERGIDGRRLAFRGPVGLDDMMREYADIDIALDPAPHNGGTTTLQAMWMGVPVVTLEGNHFVSRMGEGRAALAALKSGLRERLRSWPGWDVATYARAFERALSGTWPPP